MYFILFIVFVIVASIVVSAWNAPKSTREWFEDWTQERPHVNEWKRFDHMMVLEGPSCQFFAPSHRTRLARWNGIVYGGERAGTCRVTVWEREEWGDGYKYTRVDYTDQQADMFMDVMKGFARNEQSRISGAAEVWAKEVYDYGTSEEVGEKYRNFDYCTWMNEQKKTLVTA